MTGIIESPKSSRRSVKAANIAPKTCSIHPHDLPKSLLKRNGSERKRTAFGKNRRHPNHESITAAARLEHSIKSTVRQRRYYPVVHGQPVRTKNRIPATARTGVRSTPNRRGRMSEKTHAQPLGRGADNDHRKTLPLADSPILKPTLNNPDSDNNRVIEWRRRNAAGRKRP